MDDGIHNNDDVINRKKYIYIIICCIQTYKIMWPVLYNSDIIIMKRDIIFIVIPIIINIVYNIIYTCPGALAQNS